MIVLDASVLVELLLRTPLEPAIRSGIGGHEPSAPELIHAEALSALRSLEGAGDLDPARTLDAVRDLRRAPLRLYGHGPLLEVAWSLRANLTAYDALYVALARRLGCSFLTADARLARAPSLGVTITLVGA